MTHLYTYNTLGLVESAYRDGVLISERVVLTWEEMRAVK